MNKKLYFGLLSLAVAGAATIGATKLLDKSTAYEPRQITTESSDSYEDGEWSLGAAEYLHSIRANDITGEVNPKDVADVKRQIRQFEKSLGKASYPFSWEFAGPDNRGGRTRAFLVDRNDNNVLYCGGVMGGIFKSTNKGASWYPVDDQMEDMAISSLCQTPNGTIYAGTGESFTGSGGQEAFTPGFAGGGIYKSTDNGETFEKITSTQGFTFVNKVVSHPTKNQVFAATNTGLRVSAEGNDAQWTMVQGGNARDIVLDKNGNALLYTNTVYHSSDPASSGSYTAVDGIPLGGATRAVSAFSESDPNYAYIVLVGRSTFNGPLGQVTAANGLLGIYQSKDNGKTFTQVVGNTTSFFSPFTIETLATSASTVHSQGYYDLCVGVHPQNKERLFIGGIDFAEWTPQTGPLIVGNGNDVKANPFGIHVDKHNIVFDTKSDPIIMYITSDGGVSRTTNKELNNYTTLYNGLGTTQFYGIAAGTNGIVVGGTQDNNSMVIDGNGNTPQAAEDIIGGDGFQCEVSTINPDILFAESQNGNMRRSLNAGGNTSPIWDGRIGTSDYMANVTAEGTVRQPNNIFNTPMQLWEDLTDSTNRLFFALDEGVWMANGAVTEPSPQWFRVLSTSFAPNVMEVSPDGDVLYVAGLRANNVYRVSGLNSVTWDTAMHPGATIPPSLEITEISGNLPGSRSVTDIAADPHNPDRVIITLGNYGSSAFVYVSENALDATPTWRSIQGALPRFPVYDAEVSITEPNTLILGTEFGIYYTQNGNATTPTWTFNQDSFPRVPVFQLRQVEGKVFQSGARTGAMLYAGTHGRGIWKSSSLLTNVRNVTKVNPIQLKAYPNPAKGQVNVSVNVNKSEKVTFDVINYQGQTLKSVQHDLSPATSSVSLKVSDLPAGNYLISVKGASVSGAAKFIKID